MSSDASHPINGPAFASRVSNSSKKKAKITSTNSAGPQQVSVEVPAAGGSVTSVTSLGNLTDVTVNQTTAGSFLQIQSAGGNFVSTAIIDSDTLASASSTTIHSGESLKAYIDTQDTSGTITFSNKTIDLDSNTLTGTLAEFNTALQGDSFVSLTGSETLTNKTLTSPVLNTGVSGTAVLDEDNMASDSATQLATQQSIKAYVDAQILTEDTIAELNDTTISSASDGHFLVHTGSAWVNEAPATALASSAEQYADPIRRL